MAYTNIPANLYDYFSTINQRIRKLESAPDQAMTTAVSAQSLALTSQSVATNAQIQAIAAQMTALSASAQATVAQSTASFAQSLGYASSAQATVAQTTANGKNKIVYSLSTPGSTANSAGDLWFQYSGSGLLIGQFVGLGGTSWQSQTITSTIIGNLDAGKITTGTLSAISITAGSGGTGFNVTAAGYMSANGAYIQGTVVATSGVFSGSIQATTGYFGDVTNHWAIGTGGITGVGTATISGGSINGTSLDIGSGVFTVSSAGAVNASNIVATGGSIGGINMQSNSIYTGTSFATATSYWNNSGNSYFNNITINTNGNYLGTLTTGSATATSADTSITGIYSDNSGYLFVKGTHASLVYIHNQTASSATKMIQFQASGNAWGGIQMNGSASAPTFFTSSDYRLKENIQPYTGSIDLLNKLRVVSFNEKTDPNKKQIVGFIADEFASVFPDWVDGDKDAVDADGNPVYQTISTTNLINYLVGAIQELSTEVETLKGANNGTTTSA